MSIQPSILPRIHRFLARRSAAQVAIICVALQFGATTLDAMTGPEVIAMPFYFIPIAVSAWYVGVTLGVLNAMLSTALALSIQLGALGIDNNAQPYRGPANAILRMAAFFLVAVLVSRLRASTERTVQRGRGVRRPRTISSGEFTYVTLDEFTEPRSRRARVPSGEIL